MQELPIFEVDKEQNLVYPIHMSCKTPDLCKLGDFYSLCPDCMLALEEAAIKNAANMGSPPYFYCGICGRKMASKDYARHAALYPKGECSDLEDFHSTKTFTPEEGLIDKWLEENRDLMDDLVKGGD